MAENKKTSAEVLAELKDVLAAAKTALKESPADEKLQLALKEAQAAFDKAEEVESVENGTKADKAGKVKTAPQRKRSPLKKVEQPAEDAKGKPKCLKKYPKQVPAQCRICKSHVECKAGTR